MRVGRKAVAISLIAGACLCALLVVALNSLIEKNHDPIREEIQKALGRSLQFDQLQLSLWGGLALAAMDLRIAEDPQFAATPFIQSRELRMKVRWLPLLLGRVAIKEFSLREPEIQIIKNEAGELNISTLLATDREAAPTDGTRKPQPEKEPIRRPQVALSISGLRVSQGRILYIDRAAKEPFEMQVQNLELSLRGSALTGKADLKLVARLSENRAQNISLEGRIGPYDAEREWTKYPLDLELNVESLPLPNLIRALPLVREQIPPYLGISGPISIKAKLSGTVERPTVRDLRVAGPFFGATESNTTMKGELDLSKGASWKDGVVKGQIVVDPIGLDQLRAVPFLQQGLPAALVADGPLSVSSELSGRIEDLRIETLVKAEESELRYGNWLRKAKGLAAQLELNVRNQEDRLVLEDSRLTLHNVKLGFSGAIERSAERLLSLRLRLDRASLSGWGSLFTPLAPYHTRGTLNLDLSVKRALGLPQGELDLRGALTLTDVHAREKSSGRDVGPFNSTVSFAGKQARLEPSSLRLGSSTLAFEATVPDLVRPEIHYTVRSPRLSLGDVTAQPAYHSDWLKELKSAGVVHAGQGALTLRGRFSSAEGTVQEILYRNLQGEVSWTAAGTSVKGVAFHALGGTFRVDGSWQAGASDRERLTVNARIEGMDLKALLAQKFPGFKGQLAGKLDLKARLRADGKNGSPLRDSVRGEGETEIRDGLVKDINLPERVLTGVTGLPGISSLVSSPFPARYRSVLERPDTPFHKLAASFTIADKRIHARAFVLATPDYTVQGEGWVGFDRTMRWAAELITSPQFGQELAREHRNAHYLLDRRGRLAVPFRIEGILPQVQPKPDTQWLAQQIERGLSQRGLEGTTGGDRDQRRKERQDRIQKER